MKLIRDLEDGEVDVSSLRKEVKDYLDNEKDEISQELQSVLDSLETNSKTFEIGMVLREIEKERQRLNRILYLLQENDWIDLPRILPAMLRDGLIDGEIEEKLLEKPFTPLELIEILKSLPTKTGAGVTQYLPGTVHGLIEKLTVLIGEYSAGNTTVLPQIEAVLRKLHQKQEICYKDYKSFCEELGTCPHF